MLFPLPAKMSHWERALFRLETKWSRKEVSYIKSFNRSQRQLSIVGDAET
jgi:hypothetical protein